MNASAFPYVGIDGCPAGWLAVALSDEGGGKTMVFPTLEALWRRHAGASALLIDIPLGLPADARPRECDRLARQFLGAGRSSSIFNPPCRAALAAVQYTDACAANDRVTGKKLSKQSYNIMKKIREADEILARYPAARSLLHEAHPELCFMALGDRAIPSSKKNHEGILARLAIIQQILPAAYALAVRAMDTVKRADAGRDDILDALVLAVTARLGRGRYRTLPANPPLDERGIPMAIHYREWPPTDPVR